MDLKSGHHGNVQSVKQTPDWCYYYFILHQIYTLQSDEQIISDLSFSDSLLVSFYLLLGQAIVFSFQFLHLGLQCFFILWSVLLKPAQSKEGRTGHLQFLQGIGLQLLPHVPQSLLPVDKLQWIILAENKILW